MFQIWDKQYVGCSGCGMFEMWDVEDVGCWDVGCRGCGMFVMWDAGCGMFAGMWDVDLQNTHFFKALYECSNERCFSQRKLN